eukprot:3692800-Pleurochrysis_carterae.AAC.5
MSAVIAAIPFGNLEANKNKKLLDIGVEALYDADHDVVAPHGIFGQAYDGDNLSVSGKMDKTKAAESTTEAQVHGGCATHARHTHSHTGSRTHARTHISAHAQQHTRTSTRSRKHVP